MAEVTPDYVKIPGAQPRFGTEQGFKSMFLEGGMFDDRNNELEDV